MKKRLLLLLLSAAILLVSCGVTTDESQPDTSPAESGEASETSSPDERVYTNVSKNKPYTLSAAADKNYPDLFGQQLTDGEKASTYGSDYQDVRMVGFKEDVSVVIDLGEDGKDLVAFSARSLQFSRDGVALAMSIRIFGSADGTKWNGIGKAFFTTGNDKEVREARYESEEPLDYRYIRFTITIRSGSAFFFLDELEVFADVAKKEKTDYAMLAYQSGAPKKDLSDLKTSDSSFHRFSANVAKGCAYTFENASFDERAPKNDTLLTDGAPTGRLFGENVFVGLDAPGAPSITLDLGNRYNNLYGFVLHALGGGTNVCLPGAVDVYGSEDGKNFAPIGRAYGSDTNHLAYTVLSDCFLRSRYVRFTMQGGEGFFWIEEIEVLAGFAEEWQHELYAPVRFPKVETDVFADPSAPDAKNEQNLLLGLSQQVMTSFYYAANEHRDETPAETTLLTDGKKAKEIYCYSGEWFFHRGGGAIDFFYDLGTICALRSFDVSLLEQAEWGISRPRNITILLSNDGNVWYPVAKYERDKIENLTYSSAATRMNIFLPLERPVAARFVRFRIESGFLFADELTATGTKVIPTGTVQLSDTGILPSYCYTTEEGSYATTENTGVGAKDIAIVYGEKGDENTLLPFVAYVDQSGTILDTFMDGFLYLPTGKMPSGAATHMNTVKGDWEYLFGNTFDGVNGFDRLNEVVGKVKTELDKPDYKVMVYLTLLVPREDTTNFGDVDGDGISENLSQREDREKMIRWYLDKCIDEFDSRGYEHLILDGFYWIDEAVGWEKDTSTIIRETADLVHEKGFRLLWVPYYTAYRYETGYELGFDMVCMQPNYAFTLDTPASRLDLTADRTRTYQMCVEIENTYRSMDDPKLARKYLQYLACGMNSGYADAIHVYYDDIDNYAVMAYGENPLSRLQYDATYAFAKGFLTPTPEKREQFCFYGNTDAPTEDTLRLGNEYAFFTLASAPSHGTVTLCENGDFRYFPEPGFSGEDVFMYTYNNLMNESEICAASVSVQ